MKSTAAGESTRPKSGLQRYLSPLVRELGSVGRLWRNREAMIVLSFSALTSIAGVVGNRVLTETVPPRALGEVYLYMTVVLWATVPTAGAAVYFVRHWPIALSRGLARKFGRAIGLAMIVQGGVAALVIGGFYFAYSGARTLELALWLWVTSMAFAVGQAYEPAQNSARRRLAAGTIGFFGTSFRPFSLTIGALLVAAPTGLWLLKAQAVHYCAWALVAVTAYVVLARKLDSTVTATAEEAQARKDLSLGSFLAHWTPYLLGTLATQGCVSAERWGLARLVDAGGIAIFVQGIGLAVAMSNAATGFLNNYFYPLIFQAAQGPSPLRSAARPMAKYFVLTVIVLLGSVGIIAFFAPVMTTLLFGARYHAVSAVLPWAMLGAGLAALGEGVGIVSYTARETVVTNGARVTSQVAYIVTLVLCRPQHDPALVFSWIYAGRGALYALMMTCIAVWLMRRERLGAAPSL